MKVDILTKEERSRRMSAVRSIGNRSTEWKVRARLIRKGLRGWEMHPADLPGKPDFVFRKQGFVLFIDGCFWHGYPECKRPFPSNNRQHWFMKIRGNVVRRRKVIHQLRRIGFKTLRVWEHEIRNAENDFLNKVIQLMDRTTNNA